MQSSFATIARAAVMAGICILLGSTLGCSSTYVAPGKPVDFKALGLTRDQLTDASISQAMAKMPLAKFPCGIAAVRIQAPDYHSTLADTYGTGNYCVVTTRNIEGEVDWKRLQNLPMCTGIAPLNRLVLSNKLNNDLELREAAASLHADMLLIYTIDTTFRVEDHLAPLTVVTLGLSPNMSAQVVSTASAVLMDTRNGYLYGYSEATDHGVQLTNGWMTESAVEDAIKRTESRAFGKLTVDLQNTWGGVVKNFAVAPKMADVQPQ